MAVFHKKYRNTGLQAFGQAFTVGADGRLSPDPDAATEAALGQLNNYEVRAEKKAPAPKKVEKPKEEPKEEAPTPEAKAELEESETKPAPKKKRTRKKASKKA